MVLLKNVKWDYRISIAFAMIAFAISFISGILAGNKVTVVLSKAFILTIIFAVLGYTIVYVIRKYVPEIFDISLSVEQSSDTENGEIGDQEVSENLTTETGEGAGDNLSSNTEIAPTDESSFIKLDSDNIDSISSGKKTASMGRHVFEDDGVKYEPKIMAEAIRTMMKKDND